MDTLDYCAVVNALQSQGFWWCDNALPKALTETLLAELIQLQQAEKLQRAGVGRAQQHRLHSSIRRDHIHWLSGETAAQRAYLQLMDELQQQLNRRLFLGLRSSESHYAHYPAGGFYKKHRDSFSGARNRLLSVVAYLNQHWSTADGGELVLYDAEERVALCLPPSAGSLVIFLSEEVVHEVLPTQVDRYSIAGWHRVIDKNLFTI